MAWDDDLTDEQRRIASHTARTVRLVAGPGTGKTRVMTRRIAYLIEDRGVSPSAILALTFSRAAAQELRERLEDLLGEDTGDRPGVYTLHAFALRQLLRMGGAPTLPSPIRIADDYDERHVVAEELASLTHSGVRDVEKETQLLASDWESLDAEDEDWERQHPNPAFLAAWRQHRAVYGYTLRAELVYALKKAFDEDPDLEVEPAFTHLLVDEYQDLNHCELAVLERLTGADRHLFVAGDDDQSIYGFRNAFPLGLREFPDTYPEAVSEELAECHRCDRDILAMALNVAEQDIDRIPKALAPRDNAGEGQVDGLSFRNISHEARNIARISRQLVDDAEVPPNEILILLRNNPGGVYSAPIIEQLAEVGLDAELPSNPFAALDDPDGRQVVCFLRLVKDSGDALAWRELLKLRNNGLGDGSLMAIYRLAAERGERYTTTVQAIADDPGVLDHARRNRIADEVADINGLLTEAEGLIDEEAGEGLERIFEMAGSLDGEERDEMNELLLGLVLDDDEATLGDVEEALHGSRGSWDEEEREGIPDRVQIMSMHSAKGLTADAVIVAACDDELIPGNASAPRDLDDQRRLLYVSLTRARHFLFVSFARERRGQQSYRARVSERRTFTRFLRDFLPLRTP